MGNTQYSLTFLPEVLRRASRRMAFRWGSTAFDWLKKGKDWVDWSTFEKSSHLAGLCTEVKNHPIGEPLPVRMYPCGENVFLRFFGWELLVVLRIFLRGNNSLAEILGKSNMASRKKHLKMLVAMSSSPAVYTGLV